MAVRGVYQKANRIELERQWFVDQLNFRFSLQVDSVVANEKGGYLMSHLISGKMDNSKEFTLNQQLKHHKQIRFLRYRANGQCDVISRWANKSKVGDSIQIDSFKNQILFFRDGDTISRAKISNFLRERLF